MPPDRAHAVILAGWLLLTLPVVFRRNPSDSKWVALLVCTATVIAVVLHIPALTFDSWADQYVVEIALSAALLALTWVAQIAMRHRAGPRPVRPWYARLGILALGATAAAGLSWAVLMEPVRLVLPACGIGVLVGVGSVATRILMHRCGSPDAGSRAH